MTSGDLIGEIKSVESLLRIHQAQLLTHMRLAKLPTGLLINFNVFKLKNVLSATFFYFVRFVSFVVQQTR